MYIYVYIYIHIIYIYIYIHIYLYTYIYIYMNRSWFRRYFWWTSNFPMHQKVSRKKIWYPTNFICFFLIISKKLFQSFSDSFSWFWDIFCWMLLTCMQCDFHFNGIFNILRIHTFTFVILHFQDMSFTFNVKKKV